MGIKPLVSRLLSLFSILLLVACGLPDEQKKESAELPKAITEAESYVDGRVKALAAQLEAEAPLQPYAEREGWSSKFEAAKADLVHAKGILAKEVQVLLKQDKSADAPKMRAELQRVRVAIGNARETAKFPEQRFAYLKSVREHAPATFSEAGRLHAAILADKAVLTRAVGQYQAAYPTRRDDIAKRAGEAIRIFEVSEQTFQGIALKGDPRKPETLDYAVLGDGHLFLKEHLAKSAQQRLKVGKDLEGLNKSYSKILIDMKDDYSACASRTSWEESEFVEWPTEHTYDYPCAPVSDDAHETAEDFDDADAELAKHYKSWGSWTTRLYTFRDVSDADVQELWAELKLDPLASWPRGDNEATFWIRATEAKFYHRYAIVENGVRRDGDWEEVTAEFYQKHEDHLGMSLVEKASGQFEDETITDPSPAGMSLVGNDRAGKWESRGGNTIWIWGGPYAHSYGGLYGPGWGGYNRTEWDDWGRNRRSGTVYTGSSSSPTYGSAGERTRSGPLVNNEYAKRGGFKEASAPIRGSGPSGRGGGPQGGGK